jgi:hypothetical protein
MLIIRTSQGDRFADFVRRLVQGQVKPRLTGAATGMQSLVGRVTERGHADRQDDPHGVVNDRHA